MKICYINPTFLIRRPIAELINRLGNNHDVAIFVPRKPFKEIDKSWHANIALKKSKIYSYPAVNLPFLNFEWPIPISPIFFINLSKIFKHYSIIHMWTYFYINSLFTLLYKAFKRKKIKLIMTCDTFPAYSFKSGKTIDMLFKVYIRLFGRFLFGTPDKIHLYGKSLIPFARKIGINQKKLAVIPTGINLKKFSNTKRNIREKLGFKKEDVILVYAGLIVPRKGIDIMLKTLSKIKNKNIKLLLVGEGPSKKRYIKLAKKLRLTNKVKFTGWRKDIPQIFNSSDILFLPSRGEGLPGIVMEAMASGLPVVASDIPCIHDLIENEKSGFLCPMNNIKCFVDQIKKAKKNSAKISKSAFKKISKFKWELLIKKYLEMYNKSKTLY